MDGYIWGMIWTESRFEHSAPLLRHKIRSRVQVFTILRLHTGLPLIGRESRGLRLRAGQRDRRQQPQIALDVYAGLIGAQKLGRIILRAPTTEKLVPSEVIGEGVGPSQLQAGQCFHSPRTEQGLHFCRDFSGR